MGYVGKMIKIRDQKTADQIGLNVWRSRDSRSYTWTEMTTSHLRNCARMLFERAMQETTLIELGEIGRHHQDAVIEMLDTVDMMIALVNWREQRDKQTDDHSN
jgi:hypothetical protein